MILSDMFGDMFGDLCLALITYPCREERSRRTEQLMVRITELEKQGDEATALHADEIARMKARPPPHLLPVPLINNSHSDWLS